MMSVGRTTGATRTGAAAGPVVAGIAGTVASGAIAIVARTVAIVARTLAAVTGTVAGVMAAVTGTLAAVARTVTGVMAAVSGALAAVTGTRTAAGRSRGRLMGTLVAPSATLGLGHGNRKGSAQQQDCYASKDSFHKPNSLMVVTY